VSANTLGKEHRYMQLPISTKWGIWSLKVSVS
jgi:hypothetical protein